VINTTLAATAWLSLQQETMRLPCVAYATARSIDVLERKAEFEEQKCLLFLLSASDIPFGERANLFQSILQSIINSKPNKYGLFARETYSITENRRSIRGG